MSGAANERAGELDRALTRIYERISDWEEALAERAGLSPRQCHAVAELGRAGKARMKALADRLGVSTGTLTVMAERLLKRGLIVRERDPEDGRSFFVSLSPKGRAVADEHGRLHAILYEALDGALSPAERSALRGAAAKLDGMALSPVEEKERSGRGRPESR